MAKGDSFGAGAWRSLQRPAADREPNTKSRKAYDLIRADIIGGRLAPSSKLLTETITRHYGIGAGPMREAMTRLAAEGLLSSEGQKGFRVAGASAADLVDIGRTRLQLEPRAVRRSIANGDVAWEVDLMKALGGWQRSASAALDGVEPDPDGLARARRDVHFALLAGCDSPWLLHFCQRIHDQTERYRRRFSPADAERQLFMADHEAVFQAALRRDAEQCAGLLARRIVSETRQTLADMVAFGFAPDPAAEAALAREAEDCDAGPA